jgi:hypothetical protein
MRPKPAGPFVLLSASWEKKVRELVRSGNLDFEFVACGCRPGTEGTPA